MNLFENLQLMKESYTSIVSEFKEFLNNKNAQYIASEIDETKDGMQIVIYNGDWKHEHLYMKHLLDEFFTNKGINISITSEEIGESDQDTFSARYDITFNVKSPEYSADGSIWSDTDSTEQDLNDGLYEGKHYGGAFDINDTAYFTQDDLDEFSNEVIEQLSNATHADIIADVVDCYFDEDINELELTLSYNEYEHTHKEKIDMRKIKTPKDLIKAYSYKFVNDFLWCFTADTNHNEMIKESNDKSKEDIERKLIQLIQDKLAGPLADRAGSSYFYTQGKQHFMAIPISTNSDSFDFYSYEKDLKKVFPNLPIYSMMDDYEMVIDVTRFYRELTESNHNEMIKDYATGEKIYNALVEYLNSLDQIGMDGKDCNWEPSNFNAKNLNADGEIYLVSDAYILIYPYINEWAEDYFKVLVVEADELNVQIKNGIENIVNKFKTNNWKLVFEG